MNVMEATQQFISHRKETIKRFVHKLFLTLTALTLALVIFFDVNAKIYAPIIFVFTSLSFSFLFIFNIKNHDYPIVNWKYSKLLHITSRVSELLLFCSCILLMLSAAHDYESISHVYYSLFGIIISFLLLPPDNAICVESEDA